MRKDRCKIVIEFTADLDPIAGTWHNIEDYVNDIKRQLTGEFNGIQETSYRREIRIISSEVNQDPAYQDK
jgi:hypothetical protein